MTTAETHQGFTMERGNVKMEHTKHGWRLVLQLGFTAHLDVREDGEKMWFNRFIQGLQYNRLDGPARIFPGGDTQFRK